MPESNYIRSKKIPERPACLRYSPIDDRETIATTYQLTEEKERIGSFFVLDAELNMKRNIRASGGIFRFNTFPHCPDKVFAVLTTDGMLLSLDYCENRFLTTDEKGRVLVVDSNSLKELSRWKAHHLPCTSDSSNCEVWSCAWLDSNVAASGADDSLLKLWDLRTGTTPTVVNKSHEGGVVFLEKRNECYFITGCYDENIRLFDTRIPNKPVKITKVCGGSWSIVKRYANEADYNLIACMYGGWQILDKNLDAFHVQSDHGSSLLYGADMKVDGREFIVSSCTFNDSMVHQHRLTIN